jgi:hypothetical protein
MDIRGVSYVKVGNVASEAWIVRAAYQETFCKTCHSSTVEHTYATGLLVPARCVTSCSSVRCNLHPMSDPTPL